jgi:hypothetical protein
VSDSYLNRPLLGMTLNKNVLKNIGGEITDGILLNEDEQKIKVITGAEIIYPLGDSAPRSWSRRFESHRRGRIFSKEGTFAGPWMCVNVNQELTVGWWKEERHSSDATTKSAGFESRPHGPPMDVVLLYSCCVVQKRRKEKGGWPWVAGESTPEPRRTT